MLMLLGMSSAVFPLVILRTWEKGILICLWCGCVGVWMHGCM